MLKAMWKSMTPTSFVVVMRLSFLQHERDQRTQGKLIPGWSTLIGPAAAGGPTWSPTSKSAARCSNDFDSTSAVKRKNHLAEVVRSKPGRPAYRGKHRIPLFWPLFTYPTPRGSIVGPCKTLVKSLFCPINASPNEFLVQTLLEPPPLLKPTFLRGGVSKMSKK